jgi:competence protein ComEC
VLQPAASLPSVTADALKKWLLLSDRAAFASPAVSLAAGTAAGCTLYFGLPAAPPPLVLPALGAVLLAATVRQALYPAGRIALMVALIVAGLLFGLARSEMRTRAAGAVPAIDTRGNAVAVSGWLAAVETGATGRSRLVVRVPGNTATPAYRVRVLGSAGEVRPGDPVTLDAVLAPPRAAAVPGGYDFAFRAWFERIAATGYAIAPARPGPAVATEGAARRLARLRWAMAERIASHLPERTGALAAALLTGDRSRLHPDDIEALRGSGLGHVLAISGMHMALFAGGVFFAVRLAMAGWTSWASRYDPAVPAALAGLAAAAIYLLLSGGSIPTQRAFIMTASVLGAVLARRRALSLHTLALAMLAVLTLTPEAVVTPGFQMSFAAVAALIAAAQVWQARRPPAAPLDPGRGLRSFLGGLSTTSLVAGLATSGFAAFHFHRLAAWGLAGNLLAMPAFSLVVMPAGVLALFLMPVGLEALPLTVMARGLDVVLWVAHRVASWPGAYSAVPSAPGWVLAVYALGFSLVTAGQGAARLTGLATILVALAGWSTAERPDLFVTRDGVVIARMADAAGAPGVERWGVSDPRRSRFPARVFLEGEGAGQDGRPPRLDLDCDRLGCSGTLPGGARFAVLDAFDGLAEDCRRTALIVTPQPVPAHRRRQCAARIIDGSELDERGGALVWVQAGAIRRVLHALPAGQRRPWHRRETRRGPQA